MGCTQYKPYSLLYAYGHQLKILKPVKLGREKHNAKELWLCSILVFSNALKHSSEWRVHGHQDPNLGRKHRSQIPDREHALPSIQMSDDGE